MKSIERELQQKNMEKNYRLETTIEITMYIDISDKVCL